MTRINGRFRDAAVVLLFLALIFASTIPFAIWGEAGLS